MTTLEVDAVGKTPRSVPEPPMTVSIAPNVRKLRRELTYRPIDYAEDATLRGDITAEHMVDAIDEYLGEYWWYRWFLKPRRELLRQLCLRLNNTTFYYNRSLSSHDLSVFDSLVQDHTYLNQLEDMLKSVPATLSSTELGIAADVSYTLNHRGRSYYAPNETSLRTALRTLRMDEIKNQNHAKLSLVDKDPK